MGNVNSAPIDFIELVDDLVDGCIGMDCAAGIAVGGPVWI